MSKKNARGSNELRSAFKALQVNAPLRLPKSGPGMRPPTEATQHEITGKEAPRSEVPLSTCTQFEDTQNTAKTKRAKSDTNDHQHSHSEESQYGLPQKEQPHFHQPKTEGHSSLVPRGVATKHEEPQYERGINPREATQNEHAQNEAPETRTNQGFFKLAHSVFSEPLLQELSGDCFRLFLWISSRAWRFSKSNGQVRASVRFIEEQTGMSHATVSRSLKTLKEKHLIRLVETDFKRGNIWQVSAIALGAKGPEDNPPRGERPRSEDAHSERGTASNREMSGLKTITKVPRNECNIRSINNKKDLKKEAGMVSFAFGIEEPMAPELRESAIERFERELADSDKAMLIQKFVESEFPHGFLPPSSVIKNMAALDWFRVTLESGARAI